MAATSIHGKENKNLSIQTHWTNGLETRYVAIGNQVLYIVYLNDDLGLTLTSFTAQSDYFLRLINRKG